MATLTTPTPTTLRLAQGTTLLLSSLTAGTSLSLSYFLIPRLLESPTPVMLTQWARTYARGAAVMPAAALLSAAGMFWLSFVSKAGERVKGGYLAGGLLTVGIVPYTILVMTGTNKTLKGLEGEMGIESAAAAAGKEVGVEAERSAKGLVDWWGVLNLGRAGLLIAGVGCGLWATI
jgi:hypothetical protein